MRSTIICAVLAFAGCSAPTHPSSSPAVDEGRCTPAAGVDAAAERQRCTAKGCLYQQRLTCRGVDVDDETAERERRAAAAGKVPCACVCETDREACRNVP